MSRFAFRSRIPQLGVHSQSCNQAGLGRATYTAEQIQHCKTAITNKDQLSIRQIDRRLQELSRRELRRVRDYEQSNKGRKGLLRALDRKLQD